MSELTDRLRQYAVNHDRSAKRLMSTLLAGGVPMAGEASYAYAIAAHKKKASDLREAADLLEGKQ